MNKLIAAFFAMMLVLPLYAQHKVGDLLKTMPDSIMPLLTKNNRLDMIDFREAKMRAEVINKLGGSSEMTTYTADSLIILMSENLSVKMLLLESEEEYDSCRQVICLVSNYTIASSGDRETVADYYSVRWKPLFRPKVLSPVIPVSTINRRDEEILSKPIM